MLERANNIVISIISTLFIFFNFGTTMAQFPESFSPSLPQGWQVFNGLNGLGTNEQWQPYLGSSWHMRVGYEDVIGGLSQDWLLTPQFTITDTDSSGIIFDQKQEVNIDYGSTYKVFVTTDATADLNSSWTLIDSWGESDFTIDWTSRYIELSTYLNIPIYLAFVLEQDDGDSWLIDNVRRHGRCQGQSYTVTKEPFYSAIPKNQFPGIDLNLNFTHLLDTTTTYTVKLAIERFEDWAAGPIPLSAIPHMDTLIVEDLPNMNDFLYYNQSIAFSGFPYLIPGRYNAFVYDSGYSLNPCDEPCPSTLPTQPGYMHQEIYCTNSCTFGCGIPYHFFDVTDNLYRRFELSPDFTVLSPNGTTSTIIVGNTYEITTASFLDSVEFFTIPGLTASGESARIVISNVTNGLPSNTIIGQSDYYTYSVNEATDSIQQFVVPTADLNGSPLWLQPGTYFIGFEKPASTSSYGLLASESPNATGTNFVSIDGSSFISIGDALNTGDVFSPYIGAILTECPTNTVFETVSECNSFTWITNGQTYTQTGQYTTVLTNAQGCDSTVTLDLTITQPNTGSETMTECNSYTWNTNGQTYTQSGQYTEVLTNQSGCDSTVTLNLTIEFVDITSQPVDQTVVVGNNGQFIVTTSATNPTYQWQVDDGMGWSNLSNAGQYSGTDTDVLTISNVQFGQNNFLYRCNITSGNCETTSSVGILTIQDNAGLNDINKNIFNVYPNPTSNSFTISSDNLINSEFKIIDAQGSEVLTGTMNGQEHTIDISKLSNGVYSVVFNNTEYPVVSVIKE
ncbi:T9SS type A sorting domain-containing protein [Crocinitomicaceae bacterium]|nr:T9SS type A sorting domain-containing protein [Crocinitomicaceae bacterium]